MRTSVAEQVFGEILSTVGGTVAETALVIAPCFEVEKACELRTRGFGLE